MDLETKYRKSPHLQCVDNGSNAIIWHSLFGFPRIVPRSVVSFLTNFETPQSLHDYWNKATDSAKQGIEDLVTCHFLSPTELDERQLLAQAMHEREQTITNGELISYLELIMSEACNLRCTYCIHFNNLETSDRINNTRKIMGLKVAIEAVEGYLRILRSHGRKVAVVNFGGGEPLLAWPVIEQVLEYCMNRYSPEFEFRFTMNTNATLITPEIAERLKWYQVEIASSLDGLREGNDRVRLTKKGAGTYDLILHGYNNLEEAGYPLDGIAVTINEQNFPVLDESIIDWAADRGMNEVRIDIDVIDMVDIPVHDIVERLIRVRSYAHARNITVAGFWSRPTENLNDSTLTAHVSFCGAVRGNSMCVSPSGKIYGCGYSNTQLGSLDAMEGFHSEGTPYHQFVRDHLTGTMQMCKGCMIEGQCGGGCNITQEFAKATHSNKLDRMCEFYRTMTQELLREQIPM